MTLLIAVVKLIILILSHVVVQRQVRNAFRLEVLDEISHA